ncbi:hypothetical protein ACFYO1_26505 [Nocardia sp. NPDC006044]|uniref:hypothetical protein n=1 Tax=Nocardia sp. NPDC006044 TaxID=3364306 RepID=UPI003699E463
MQALVATLVGMCVMGTSGLVSATATAAPTHGAPVVLATNIENAGAELAVSAGRFVEQAATGVVDLVDAAGQLVEQLVPVVTVDDMARRVKFAITEGGQRMRVTVEGGIRAGAKVVGNFVSEAGTTVMKCLTEGTATALETALIAAISGGITAVLAGGPIGIVTSAALAGLAGAWRGFVSGCADGVTAA